MRYVVLLLIGCVGCDEAELEDVDVDIKATADTMPTMHVRERACLPGTTVEIDLEAEEAVYTIELLAPGMTWRMLSQDVGDYVDPGSVLASPVERDGTLLRFPCGRLEDPRPSNRARVTWLTLG